MDRRDKSGGHIMIAGTGRAGTTLLVQMFAALKFDVGFSAAQLTDVDAISHAGLEYSPARYLDFPLVVKSPVLSIELRNLLADDLIKVRSVIIPVRQIGDAADSRRRVTANGSRRGALWGTENPSEQEAVLLDYSHRLLCTVADYGLPHVLISFPQFVRDSSYAFAQLEPVLTPFGVQKREFLSVFCKVARPELVSDFGRPIQPLRNPRKDLFSI